MLQKYVGTLMGRLKDQVNAGWGSAVVDLVKWYTWTTFDIVGDLGFGETFGCLTSDRYHFWSEMVFSHFKAAALVTSVRFYPFVERFLRWCLPSDVINRQGHFQLSREKIHRRLRNGGRGKADFMAYVLDPKVEGQMSLKEIETTFNILIIAGSETTASALAGTTGYLVGNPMCLAMLVKEIRDAFEREDEICLSGLAKLPYLNAVIEEGLRMAPPVPSGLPRVVPNGGGMVCGEWLPGGVCVPSKFWTSSPGLPANTSHRHTSPFPNIPPITLPSTSTALTSSFPSVGYRPKSPHNSQMTRKQLFSLFHTDQEIALARF
jgi:hypothetical protein